MLTEPLGGWRNVTVRETQTAVDLAQERKALLDLDCPDAETVALLWDNLNPHIPAALYTAFEPAKARRLLERREIHSTPKQGSGLEVADIERSVFTKHCLSRRIGDIDTLCREAKAWAEARNAAQSGVD